MKNTSGWWFLLVSTHPCRTLKGVRSEYCESIEVADNDDGSDV